MLRKMEREKQVYHPVPASMRPEQQCSGKSVSFLFEAQFFQGGASMRPEQQCSGKLMGGISYEP